MSVVIAYEDAGPWRKKLTIEVPAPAVDAEVGRVVKSLGKGIRLPGFRPGKAPASLIVKRFPEEVKQKVAERLVPRYWHQAEAEKGLDPLLPPSFEDYELEPGKPLTLVASVETRPEVELGDLSGFDLPQEPTEPTAAEVDEALEELRRQHATWVPVERAAAGGDLVIGTVIDGDGERRPAQVEIGAAGVVDAPDVDPKRLFLANQDFVTVNVARLEQNPAQLRSIVDRLTHLLRDGVLQPQVGHTLGFEQVAEAHRLLRERKNVGKVVLVLP